MHTGVERQTCCTAILLYLGTPRQDLKDAQIRWLKLPGPPQVGRCRGKRGGRTTPHGRGMSSSKRSNQELV